MLLLKLLLVPGLVAAVTLAVRRWGPAAGGWLAGLPVVAGPVLVFYALEQGRAFAARAAHGTLTGLLATVVFVVTYATVSRRFRWQVCVVAGWMAFAFAVTVLSRMPLSLGLSVACVFASTISARHVLPRLPEAVDGSAVRHSRSDLPVRLLATATLVVSLTALAEQLGPTLSGLLNAFPVLTTIVAAFTHAQRGRASMVAFLDGYLQSVVGFALFCLVMSMTLLSLGLTRALLAALAVQLSCHAWLLWRRSRGRATAEAPNAAGERLLGRQPHRIVKEVSRPQSLGLLILSVIGMFWFGGRFSAFDTVALLACGLAAGAALAALAAARHKSR